MRWYRARSHLAEEALATIQRLFQEGRFEVTLHFLEEMRNDVLFFVDVEQAILTATQARGLGLDAAGNPKYEVAGLATDGRLVGVVCAIRIVEGVLLITVYEVKGS